MNNLKLIRPDSPYNCPDDYSPTREWTTGMDNPLILTTIVNIIGEMGTEPLSAGDCIKKQGYYDRIER